MNRLTLWAAAAAALMVGCTPATITEQEVTDFLENFTASQNQGEASIEPFKAGLGEDFMFFGPGVDSAQTMNRDNIAADWFDSDTTMNAIHHIEIYGENASVFGISTDDYGLFTDNSKYHGIVGRENGKLVWKRWFGVNDWRTTTEMMQPRTESDEARGKYWDMYRAIMRNDFAQASLHADTALAADDQLALAYLAKMIEAAWITGSAEDYRAAYDAATELVAEDDYAAKYTIEAMGLSGEERIAAVGKALMHCPDDPMLIAWTAFWLGGDTDESMQMLERGMKRWPYMAAFHNLMGYRLMAKEDMEGALAHFKLQTRLLPDAANPWDSLGDYYVEVGNKEEARKAFEKALEVDPSFDASKRKLEELDAEDTAS